MKKLYFILVLLVMGHYGSAQSFSIDPSFQVPFNFKKTWGARGTIGHILESQNNGKLFLTGDFNIHINGKSYTSFIRCLRNGAYDPSFVLNPFTFLNSVGEVIPKNNSTFALVVSSGAYTSLDSSGLINNTNWINNYRKTVSCSQSARPYFYSDGSSLMGNSRGQQQNSCRIINPPDTFPHRYIIKVDPNGWWDSSFVPDANDDPTGFMPYDSTRILVWGLVRSFTQYDGRSISGLCRIFLDGTLDTTFHSPLKDTLTQGLFWPIVIPSRNEVFLIGNMYLKGGSPKYRYIVRLKENGDIDSSFAFSNASHAASWWNGMSSVAPTPDGGYIVAGAFDTYQGVAKNSIVKLDSNGILEPQYFTSPGPDSSALLGAGFPIISVEASKFGGYYVFGDFTRWDGQPTQPILRLKDLVTGIENENIEFSQIEVFPNPSNGIINISNSENIESIRIYNLQGQLIKKLKPRQKQFELPAQTGMYIIQVEDEKGNVFTKKIVKNNY
ncbi:MAG: T9SS type A sorting domain-containing protein [Flavobacteriales bacterium]|nr:T9SS type A sorting domain-containing protein [Flavobacteriales bacterium]